MEIELGQVVFSKRGHDRGAAFVVVGLFTEDGKQYAYLADGGRRKAEKPKKKKAVHIQVTKMVVPVVIEGLTGGTQVLDAEIRKALRAYSKPVS